MSRLNFIGGIATHMIIEGLAIPSGVLYFKHEDVKNVWIGKSDPDNVYVRMSGVHDFYIFKKVEFEKYMGIEIVINSQKAGG